MRSPSRSIGENLKRQRLPGRAPVDPGQPERQKSGVSMIAPGLGEVISGPGAASHHPRSAAHYGDVLQRRYGGRG